MFISYTKDFIDTLDLLLQDSYNNQTRREDFLALLTHIENLMAKSEDGDKAWFANHQLRDFFGKITVSSSGNFSGNSQVSSEKIQEGKERITINNNQDNSSYIPISGDTSANTLETKRIWKLDLLLEILENKGIICKTPYDKSDKKTRYYFYNSLFEMECQRTEIQIIKEDISEKYFKLLLKEDKEPEDGDCLAQYNLLKSDRFTIDINGALQWIDNKYYTERSISINQKRSYTRMALAIEDKHIFATKGERSGRIFTSYNTLKRELRDFCYIDGQKLISIDLKSAQPYFISQRIKKDLPNAKDFYNTITKDDIYLFFLKQWNIDNPQGYYREYNIDQKRMEDIYLNTRDDIKPEFLKILFKIKGRKSPIEDTFAKEFPTEYRYIQDHKEDLAISLQREESDIFIPVATSYADKGCLSIHDSLAFKRELLQDITKDIQKKFEEKGYTDHSIKINA